MFMNEGVHETVHCRVEHSYHDNSAKNQTKTQSKRSRISQWMGKYTRPILAVTFHRIVINIRYIGPPSYVLQSEIGANRTLQPRTTFTILSRNRNRSTILPSWLP